MAKPKVEKKMVALTPRQMRVLEEFDNLEHYYGKLTCRTFANMMVADLSAIIIDAEEYQKPISMEMSATALRKKLLYDFFNTLDNSNE